MRKNTAPPAPEPPSQLDAVGAAKWKEIAGDLPALVESDLLLVYCETWSRWKTSQEQVKELGEVVKSPSGYPIQNPWLCICDKSLEQLLRTGKALGIR